MLLLLLEWPVTFKVSLNKRGLQNYIDKLIDTAVVNFENIDIPEITEVIKIAGIRYEVNLRDIKVTEFDVGNYTFDVEEQEFAIRSASIEASFVFSILQLSYPYLQISSTVSSYIDLDVDLLANFSLNTETHLLEFKLEHYNNYLKQFQIIFSDLTLQMMFNTFKKEFDTLLLESILPTVYEAVSDEINYRLEQSYETELQNGGCKYDYLISEFLLEHDQLVVGYPTWCNTAPNETFPLIDNYTNDDVNYVLPIELLESANHFENYKMALSGMGIRVISGEQEDLCHIVLRDEEIHFDRMIKTRTYVELRCQMFSEFAIRFNENTVVIENTDFIRFDQAIFNDGLVILVGKIE